MLGRPLSSSCQQKDEAQEMSLTLCFLKPLAADAALAATDLGHVGDQSEGDVGKRLVKVATHNADPGGAVAGVGVRLVQGHDVGEVGELCVLLLEAHLEGRAKSAWDISLAGCFERITKEEAVQRDEPGQSSQQRLGKTGWGHRNFARDAAAGRERSEEILEEDTHVDY